MIAVVIDDLGLDRAHTARAIALKGPLTLAFLPYAKDLAHQTAAARVAGHELLLHLPMEPMDRAFDPGPEALLTGLPQAELHRRLVWNLGRFDGYVGVSNHMGSRFTSNAAAMRPVLDEIKARGLLFLDSRTTAATQAARIAREIGVPVAERQVFLDNARLPQAVWMQLEETAAKARATGFAIAIGHPYDTTLDVLAKWLATLEKRGFVQVPVTAIVRAQRPEVTARSDPQN